MEENSELLMKYQKLAHEYSKLKAQTSVLKTAVADEQAASTELQETLKKKDQLIRKLEQEVECLNFRNLQLTKRVSILQSDLEGIDANPKHSKAKHPNNHSAPLPDSYGVLNLELQSRIEENEKLHKQLYTIDLDHRKEITELTSTVEKLQSDLTEQERLLNSRIQEQDASIHTLQKEKIKLQVSLKNFEKELKDHKKEEAIKEKDNSSVQEDLQLQLEKAKNVIADKVLFNDTSIETYNNLNVPVMQRAKHQQLCLLMLKMHGLVSDFSRQLSDLYTFIIQRLCSTSSDSSLQEIIVRLESDLRDSISQIKVIPANFENITSAIKNESLTWDKSPVLEFSVAFQKYVICLDKMMPYLILRIQNKESWISSSPKAVELIPRLLSLCRKLMNCFKSLCRYLELLQAVGSDGKKMYVVKQSVIIQKILSNLEDLQLSFDEARKLFGSKIALDHQLPIITQDEKNTDECILSTLVSLSSTLKKLSDMMTKDIDMISCDIWYKPRICSKLHNGTVNPYAWQFKNRGSKYFQHINQPEMPSIPYEVALENSKKLYDHADNQENLTQQLEHYQNKMMQLEMDKEKWMLECTLMKAKESKNSGSVTDGEELTAQGYDEIHQFVQTTVNQLIQQIQFADSKFIAYRNECETLHQKLKMCYQRKSTLENEVESSRQTIDRMKEEQKTLTISYEDQLNTMSEHLANLNETLTAQKDEIDALKQAGGKGSKKGKSR